MRKRDKLSTPSHPVWPDAMQGTVIHSSAISSAPLHPRGSSYSIPSKFSRFSGGSGACTLFLTDIGCPGSSSFLDLQTGRLFPQGVALSLLFERMLLCRLCSSSLLCPALAAPFGRAGLPPSRVGKIWGLSSTSISRVVPMGWCEPANCEKPDFEKAPRSGTGSRRHSSLWHEGGGHVRWLS